jgi:hypothetical protein
MASPADSSAKKTRQLRISIGFRFAFFTVLLIAAVMVISEDSAFHVWSSVNWHGKVRSLALRKPAGKKG